MKIKELDKVYNPTTVEEKWSQRWLEKGLFNAGSDSKKPPFSMVIPPPNVTGSLHIGHALNNTLQDILVRYKRMRGFDVLWVPGTDHAGIATQNVVERQLAKEGIDRHTLGRDAFIKRVWEWKKESGGTIVNQLKRLGASCDWSHEQFTMSPELSRAVREVFVQLHEEGLIYRDERLINWCPRCLTALSDIEVEHEESMGKLYYIRYHCADDPDLHLLVATTRPETMFGDTAVAVHPEDERYTSFVGKEVLLPLTKRKIPVLADAMVDREFGTGAVKITPAHDFNDFEAGSRHGLERIAIFNERAHIKNDIPDILPEILQEIRDLHAHKAREKVIHALKEKGVLTKTEDHKHAIGKCYRCRTVIEPYLSPQWYVNVKPLAEEAIKAVEKGKTRFIPEGWANTYFDWMRNIKDWCISRQIWWGHQVPAWYCVSCNKNEVYEVHGEKHFTARAKPIVSRVEPKECPSCKGTEIVRDTDVLDTWFSSALWPFSTLGWPENTTELKRYYPTATLVTSFDIIFFWVARMMMMGLKFMKDIPFHDVYIHALVRDAEGQKMSKSRGNVIDPLIIMDTYGTDALRFTLAAMAAQGRDIKLAEERIEGYRNFCNKIWNLARFTLMNLEGFDASLQPSALSLQPSDKWIITRLNTAIKDVTAAIEAYRFNDAANSMYQFVWHELCDWYVERIKKDLLGEKGEDRKKAAQSVLLKVLQDSLKLLHPIMPFITEEIWDVLPKNTQTESIMQLPFPEPGEDYPDEERAITKTNTVIRDLRNFRSTNNISPSAFIKEAYFYTADESDRRLFKLEEDYIKLLAKMNEIKIAESDEMPQDAVSINSGSTAIFIPLKGLINFEEEEKRLSRDMEKALRDIEGIQKKLSNEEYCKKAPAEVVEKDRARIEELTQKRISLEQGLERIRKIKGS